LSKLFDTLEQIRENEAQQPSRPSGKSTQADGRSKRRVVVAGSLFLVVISLILLFRLIDFSSFVSHPSPATPGGETKSGDSTQASPAAVLTSPGMLTGSDTGQNYSITAADLQRWQTALQDEKLPIAEQEGLLNNIAVYYINNQQHWQGLSFLDRALQLRADSAEALINYAVALTELGLYGVAADYFERAYRANPAHPALIRNIALLRQHDILGERLLSLYDQKQRP